MPTYDYKCDACGHAFEQFQSMSAEPIRKCPKCKKAKVKRLIGTGAGLIFKGSGFYITDYRDQSYTDKAKAESSAATGSDSSKSDGGGAPASGNGEASKADTKPAAATAAESKPSAAAKSEPKPAAKRKDK
jgi:putative FmdB family regulatory protein